jgi:hypothetical protein
MEFSAAERESLHTMIMVLQGLSIVSCVFVIVLYLWLDELRQFTFKLIAYLAAADIFKGIGMLLPPDDEVMCYIQALSSVYFELSSFLWVAVVSYVMFTVIVNKDIDISRRELVFLLVCNLLPLIASVLPIIFKNYGYAQGWCFIDDSADGFMVGSILRAVVFYIPLLLVMVYCGYTYHRVIQEITRHDKPSASQASIVSHRKALLYKLYMYPIILFLSYSPVSVYRIYNFTTRGQHNFPLAFVSAFCMSLNGFLNAVAYGLTSNVRQALTAKCRRRTEEESNYSVSNESEAEFNYRKSP